MELGVSERLLRILASRGVGDAAELRRFLGPPEGALHDPLLLPDAEAALSRVAEARARGERVMVYGDFDADGLAGLAILTIALRRLGLDAAAYAPERVGDGHGLSRRAIVRAAGEGRTLILTADCGTSSGVEIEEAAGLGVDVVVTDHHHAAAWPAAARAVVNPLRSDAAYPDRRLTGAGVAWKLAQALLAEEGSGDVPASDLADLALIGTVADVAPILGENRAIARLGLAAIAGGARPGIAALMSRAGLPADRLDLDGIAFGLAPRLNAAGRVGEAARAARLLLSEDREEAEALACEIESANAERRSLTRAALAEARQALGLPGPAAEGEDLSLAPPPAGGVAANLDLPPALLVRGDWPVGIIGLVAGRLAEDTGRPAVVAAFIDPEAGLLRASCRGPLGWNLAEALLACSDLLVRHGGHAAAAGFDIEASRWPELESRFLDLAKAAPAPSASRELQLDLCLPAGAVDYELIRELALLSPAGSGNPVPTLGISGLRVVRARLAAGGHTQLVLARDRDVLDAIAFRRPELAGSLGEGDLIDVAARASSRRFGGFESIQLEVLDVAAKGMLSGSNGRMTPR